MEFRRLYAGILICLAIRPLPPLRRLERAIEEAEKADREVSPSKREMREKARILKSEVTEQSERIDCLVAAEGAGLVRRLGVDGGFKRLAEERINSSPHGLLSPKAAVVT